MWGSLARGITSTVKETASSAAASVAPHAGDVLRRVGEVVAPPTEDEASYDDDDDEDYYEDDDSYYDDDEDGVDFEVVESVGDEGEDGLNLDPFRKNKGPIFAAVDEGENATNNATVATTTMSANSLANEEPAQVFSEDKNAALQLETEKENLLKQEAEADAAGLHAEKMERERLAAIAAAEAEEHAAMLGKEKERLDTEAAAERAERERLEKEKIKQEKILEEQACRAMQADLAEAERLEEERMERKRILEEEQRRNEEMEARRRAEEKKRREEEEEEGAAEVAAAKAEAERLEKERLAAARAAKANAEAERIEKERLAAEARKLAEFKMIEEERLFAERREQEEETRRLAEEEKLERERSASDEAAARQQAEFEKIERERIEREREERRRTSEAKAKADRLEQERLAVEEAAKWAEMERLQQERIERQRQLAEQTQKEETARLRAHEEEEAAAEAAEAARRAESQRLKKERLDCLEREEQAHAQEDKEGGVANDTKSLERLEFERIAADELARAQEEGTRANNEIKNQKLLLEKVNNEARESANQLALIAQERDHFQNSNHELQTTCEQLQSDLHRAAEHISKLSQSAAEHEEIERLQWEQEARRVEEEESSLLAAAKLDLETKMSHLRQSMEAQIKSLEFELVEERKLSVDQQHELQQRLEEATVRLSSSEAEMSALRSKKEVRAAKQLQASGKAAAKAVALLDQKEEEVQQLQQVITDMRETMKKKNLEEEEAEEEMDELHNENEELNEQLEKLQKEYGEIKSKSASMSDDNEKLGGLKMELQMLEEERMREKSELESAQSKSSNDRATVLSERDAAKAQALNLEQLLAAARADLELAQTDRNRALMANENLQRALEDFQGERDAEIAILTEQSRADEEAIAAAHATSLEATREANASEMRDVQYAASKSVQNALTEMDKMEVTIQECRKANLNLRRALDEAIARLQMNQEDVIDRSLIKNIILDWHSKRGKARRDVMVLLGNILHFTEDEKDKALIGEGPGTLDKVYGAMAAPLPPAKLNVDKIEGDTVREKWVNFLLSETGEDEDGS